MPTTYFFNHGIGDNLREAFDAATANARKTYGEGPTGSIADKTAFTLMHPHALMDDDAFTLATKLISDRDPRIIDPGGPAGAIAVSPFVRSVAVDLTAVTSTGQEFTDTVMDMLRQSGELRDGDTCRPEQLSGFAATAPPDRPRDAKVWIFLGSPREGNAWLFFGIAPC